MSETKWTPGPWRVSGDDDDEFWCVAIPLSDVDFECLDIKADDRGRANCRLIASAPDLYEALEKLMSVPIVADYAGDNVHLDAAISAARAALSRAKGETTSPPPSDRATTDKREGG